MGAATWWRWLAALVAVRAAIPLVVLAASGDDLPVLPAYTYAPLHGDSFGYYAAARELIASLGRVPAALVVLAVIGVLAAGVGVVLLWRRPARRWLAVVISVSAASAVVAVVIRQMEPAGAPVVGWPLVWAVPMLPYRALGLPLDADVAFGFGFTLSLLALAVATVATAYVGWYATARRTVGLVAAALFAVWPLFTGPLTGGSAWENGQWAVDVGLHLYTEPLSTALLAVGLALLLRPGPGSTELALAGAALGLATATKLTNGLVAAVLVLVVAIGRGRRAATVLALGGLAVAPIVIAYLPLGYGPLYDELGVTAGSYWSLGAADDTWSRSLLFTPLVLGLAAPLLAVGVWFLWRHDRYALGVVLMPAIVNVVVYSVYTVTYEHPRFLYGALPSVFVLEAVGAWWLATRVRSRRAPAPA